MSTCIDCTGTIYTPCAEVGCLSTNYGKCITYSGSPLYCATGGVGTLTFTGTAVPPLTTTEVTLTPTGGTGSGLQVKVTRTVGSTAYTVTIVSVGSSYTVNDTITILGTSLGGVSPGNDLVLTITSLAALISTTSTLDQAITNLHQRLCTLTSVGLNYSGFNYSCLRVGGALTGVGSAITSAQQFTEATAVALCSLNSRTLALETPTFTVPSCVTLTSGVSTLSQILTAYGSRMCTINTNVDMTGVLSNPCISYAFSIKPTSTVVSDYFNWITTNMCGMYTILSGNLVTLGTTVDSLKTYISGVSAVPASINTSCIPGGSATSTLSAAAILFTSQICAINASLASIPSANYSLTWATNFGSTPYYGYTFNYTNTATTLQIQLDRVVATLGRMKMKLNASDFVATSDADGLNVSLASGVRFTCSQLNSCSISSLSDVTTTAPATFDGLFWSGSEWINKELIFTSTGGTVTVTRTDNPNDITVNLESTGGGTSSTFGVVTAGVLVNAVIVSSARFPIGSLPKLQKFGKVITIIGSFGVNATGSFTWAHGQQLLFGTLPAGYYPFYNQVFNVLILKYATTSGTSSTVVYQGVCVVNGSDIYIELNNPAASLTLSGTESLEIFIGGNSYATV
jgi:hypothetical protein